MGTDTAFAEGIVFLKYFCDLPDHCQPGKVVYPLDEILLLSLLAVLARAETFVDIVRFGTKMLDFLRGFLAFRDGIPSHDHLGDIFATLDTEKFQHCFTACVGVQTLHQTVDGDHSRIETRTTTVIEDVVWLQERPRSLGH